MAEDHMKYMHGTFPSPKNNDKSEHLKKEHNVSTSDSLLKARQEEHSVPPGANSPPMISGHGNR